MRKVVLAGAAVLTLALSGCQQHYTKETQTSTTAPAENKAAALSAEQPKSLYEAHQDGRIYLFYDHELFMDFMKTGHTAYMFSRIGAGPGGETMVFALTDADKKKRSGITSVELVDGKMMPKAFYGETLHDGRVYVFTDYELMQSFRRTHEAAYRYTDIGSGYGGKTVVYVLTKEASKEKPTAAIAMFKKHMAMQ